MILQNAENVMLEAPSCVRRHIHTGVEGSDSEPLKVVTFFDSAEHP